MSQSDIDEIIKSVQIELPNCELGLDETDFNVSYTNQDNKPSAASNIQTNDQTNERFVNLPDNDLDDIAKANSEKATLYQTRWALKLFRGTYVLVI